MKNRFFILLVSLISTALLAHADVSDIEAAITKARAYVGSETALRSIESIQYRGTVKLNQSDGKVVNGTVVLTYKRPYSQKIEFILEDRILVTGFNGYEGYEYIEPRNTEGRSVRNIRSIGGAELRRNMAASVENLSFFRPFEINASNTRDHGIIDVDGVSAHKIDFFHKGGIVFTRFFDTQTGDLIKSTLDTGITTIESGEIVVDGIKFSTTVKGDSKGVEIYEMNFEEIFINPEIDDAIFDFPTK